MTLSHEKDGGNKVFEFPKFDYISSKRKSAEKQAEEAANANTAKLQKQTTEDFNKKIKDLDQTSSQSNTTQTIDTTQYQSALELMLRSIQLRMFNDKNKQIDAKPAVYKSDLTSLITQTKNIFIDDVFSEGVFKGKIQDLIKKCDSLSSNQNAIFNGYFLRLTQPCSLTAHFFRVFYCHWVYNR